MMTKNNWFLAAILIGLLGSCQKEIEYKGDESDSLIVINQIIESDSTFSVEIERSRFFLEPLSTDYKLSDATVVLTNTTTGAIEALTAGTNGIYTFPMIAQEGHTYTVTVTHPKYPNASGSTTIPASIALIDVDTVSIQDPYVGKSMRATFKWNDPVGKNYYILAVKSNDLYPQPLYLMSDDVSIANSSSDFGESLTYDYFFALNDETFDGNQKMLTVQFEDELFQTGIGYEYQLYHCTEDTYRYLVSVNLASNSYGDPFSEPVKVHTNIEGGYGIFAGMNKSQIVK